MGFDRAAGGSSDLVNHEMEWGVSVAERRAQQSVSKRALKVAAYVGFLLASFVAIPVLIGIMLFPDVTALAQNALVVLGIIAFAVLFQAQSRRGARNALQIDYAASEVRLGSQDENGVFTRHRVCNFRHIQKVSVDPTRSDSPALCLHLSDEDVTIRFQDADPRSLDLVAAKISAARESAKKAPIRSRVQSMIMGIDATYREVGQRVKSRVVSRTV